MPQSAGGTVEADTGSTLENMTVSLSQEPIMGSVNITSSNTNLYWQMSESHFSMEY